jgi:RNA polymerase sigma-70 factor, ECF subfamily
MVARVCLDVLRSRQSRREEPFVEPELAGEGAIDPEDEALLADSVGLALLVVLETLSPAERLAFVLHDLFARPFEEIAPIVGRSEAATRQLASRARRRVRGAPARDADLAQQREVVEAFLAASRRGDFDALVRVLAADVTIHADASASRSGTAVDLRGARAVARGALAASARTPFARLAVVDGRVGIVVAPRGRLAIVLAFEFAGEQIAAIDVIADPTRLAALALGLLES